MSDFVVLTNRKRAVIALVHSVVFLLIALYGLLTASKTAGLLSPKAGTAGTLVPFSIYLAVTAILLLLVRVSGRTKEKVYFSFCATSAGVGLLRSIFGDAALHVGPQVRVLMLLCAVFTGALIWRTHAEVPAAE